MTVKERAQVLNKIKSTFFIEINLKLGNCL
jgi:hypothetical protein